MNAERAQYAIDQLNAMGANRRMIGATCTGCGLPSSKKLGTVKQQDLGSADKWHTRCYKMENRKGKK